MKLFIPRKKIKGVGNVVEAGKNIKLKCKINGNNNKIIIENGSKYGKDFNFIINISGDNNKIIIKEPYNVKKLRIVVGMQVPVSGASIYIDALTSIVDVNVLAFQHGSKLNIGKNCMFSNDIQIRTGELPHFIFDRETGEYLDKSSIVNIGDDCWIGEGAFILKNASIASNNIVGSKSVVTKRFDEKYTVIAGNPAQVKKRNVEWVRNLSILDDYQVYKNSFNRYLAEVGGII